MGKENGSSSRGHVIVVPYPSQGHINPLLQFAKRLASKGLKATLATTHYTLSSVSAPSVDVRPISDGFDEAGFAQAAGDTALYLHSFQTNGSKTLTRLIRSFQSSSSPVTCVVYDSFLPWALDVAGECGVYGAPFFTNSAAVSSVFCRIHLGEVALPVKVEDTPLMLPGLPPLNFPDLPYFLKLPERYPAYLAMKLSQFRNLDRADWIFANTFQGIEAEEAKGISELWPAKLIGPMVPSAYTDGRIKGDKGYGASLWKPLGQECTNWLQTKPPNSVVYVSFGSMVSLTPKQIQEIAWGLNDSGSYFLWVLRGAKHETLPDGFLKSTSEKGMIVTWCNQLEMLAHEAVGCFVTHCGWNSTLEGLSLGVPMVGVPQWADQLTDAKYVEEIWEVGVRAREDGDGVVGRGEVVRCLKEVMEGERSEVFKRNAVKWREVAKEAVSEGGSSDKCIDEFVEQLMFPDKTFSVKL